MPRPPASAFPGPPAFLDPLPSGVSGPARVSRPARVRVSGAVRAGSPGRSASPGPLPSGVSGPARPTFPGLAARCFRLPPDVFGHRPPGVPGLPASPSAPTSAPPGLAARCFRLPPDVFGHRPPGVPGRARPRLRTRPRPVFPDLSVRRSRACPPGVFGHRPPGVSGPARTASPDPPARCLRGGSRCLSGPAPVRRLRTCPRLRGAPTSASPGPLARRSRARPPASPGLPPPASSPFGAPRAPLPHPPGGPQAAPAPAHGTQGRPAGSRAPSSTGKGQKPLVRLAARRSEGALGAPGLLRKRRAASPPRFTPMAIARASAAAWVRWGMPRSRLPWARASRPK